MTGLNCIIRRLGRGENREGLRRPGLSFSLELGSSFTSIVFFNIFNIKL
jgi:hypothetical protein